MGDRVNDLEAAVRSTWNPATLAAYGEVLRAAGDLRGELIAIDLHADTHGMKPEATARRAELLRAWVGPDFDPAEFRYGFFDNVLVDYESSLMRVEALYASPAAPFIRGLQLRQWDLPRRALEPLRHPHPWLARLRVGLIYEEAPDPTWLAELEGNTPNLRELWFDGISPKLTLFDVAFAHSNVRRLVFTEDGLDFGGSRLPNVEEITGGFGSGKYIAQFFPKLRRFAGGYFYDVPSHIEVVDLPRGPSR
jgi:hypothetical protein